MTVADIWNKTPGSDSRLNLMTIPHLAGDDIVGLDKAQHGLVVCIETGSGFTINHVYMASADATTWLDITEIISHDHSGSTQGGSLMTIFDSNSKFMALQLTTTGNLLKSSWNQAVTGTGSIEDTTDGTTGERSIRLRPNGTSGSGSTIYYPHLKLDFSERAFYQTKLRIETASSLALHTGVGADDVTAADSATRKFNAEVCTAATPPADTHWLLRTADGTTPTSSDSGIVFTTSRTSVKIYHLPDLVECDLVIDTNDVFQKTTNIPVDSTTADNNIIKHSIKNSTGSDRPMHTYGSRLYYTVSDAWE